MTTERLSKRKDSALFLLEALIVFGLFWADIHHWRHVVLFSKTPYLLVLGWISLRVRGVSWKSIGFTRPASWRSVVVWGLVAGVAMECLELFATQPLLMRLLHAPPDLSFLTELRGNVAELVVVLALTWTLAAFGEELAWRGYILNRIADVIKLPRLRWPVAVVLSSAVFGLAHFELLELLGLSAFGAVLALMAYKFRRLGPGIFAHGTFNLLAILSVAGVLH